MYYDVLMTPIGWCGVVAGQTGIQRIFLAEPQREDVLVLILRQFPGCRADMEACREAVAFLVQYFQTGAEARPPALLDPGPATVFQHRVWEQASLIPFGQVRTYAWIAGQLGCHGGARAVGTALGRNPLPLIVPCHRVVCVNCSLGGFSAPGGTALKRRLLEHEGVAFDSQGRVVARQAVEK
jgi:methylated-DNA-[protein]-cysteine S-methyltransferase